jgi:hypothetical protein
MSYTNDPLNRASDRIRLMIGDVDTLEEGLTDEIYDYVLEKCDLNENRAALECLRYLVAKYANFVTEKAGGLFVKDSERFDQYSKLLRDLTSNPSMSLMKAGKPFGGGIYQSDIDANQSNSDINHHYSYLVTENR